jgi:hypothetical protein
VALVIDGWSGNTSRYGRADLTRNAALVGLSFLLRSIMLDLQFISSFNDDMTQ